MADPSETWSERFEREFEAVLRLLKRRPWLATLFVGAMAFYGWHQFIKTKDSKDAVPRTEAGSIQPTFRSSEVAKGTAAWIYIGTRINDQWQKSTADGIEPELTINIADLPIRGHTYQVTHGVHLREAAPVQQSDKSRPPMASSKGTIGAGSTVKVDDLVHVEVAESEQRVWVWAHITVVEAR